MAVSEIVHFSALVSTALVSCVVLLRQFFRDDLSEFGTSVLRHDGALTPQADSGYQCVMSRARRL